MRFRTFFTFLLLATPAFAGSTTLAVRDGNGVLRTFDVTTDGSGNYVSQSVICDGTAAATCATISGGALKVDGSAAIQPVSQSGSWSFTSLTSYAIGSTTSGQTGGLSQGAVTTSAPSYTTGQTNPLSLDTSGNLRVAGIASASYSGAITNPTSVLTRPNDTNAYSINDLIASSTTAGSIVVPSFNIVNSAGGVIIPRVRLSTNVTTGWGAVTLQVTLWSAAPTYTNGDNGAYAVATGSANRLAQYQVTLTQDADGASGNGALLVGNAAAIKLASGTAIYWDIQTLTAATPIANQTFTITPELLN